jgi:hypothetical protein
VAAGQTFEGWDMFAEEANLSAVASHSCAA